MEGYVVDKFWDKEKKKKEPIIVISLKDFNFNFGCCSPLHMLEWRRLWIVSFQENREPIEF